MNLINLKEEQGYRKERREEKRDDDELEPVEGPSVLALVYPVHTSFWSKIVRAVNRG